MIMNDLKTLDRADAIANRVAAGRPETRPETLPEITDRTGKAAAGQGAESGHPPPEALAGWLAA